MASPGPYVDVELFMTSGPWDGVTHPLLQILRDYPSHPWIRTRLGAIDLAESPSDVQLAVGVLSSRAPGLARLASISVWAAGEASPSADGGEFRVVPGFFVGRNGRVLASAGRDVVSADSTTARGSAHVVTLDARESASCDVLVFVAGDVTPETFESLRAESGDVLVAPLDADQEQSCRATGVRTLSVSRQVRVTAGELRVVGGAS